MYNTMLPQFKSMKHFIAFTQLNEDYKNLICHYEEFKNTFMSAKVKASMNCERYLLRIIESKNVLGIDTEADREMLKEIKKV